MGTLNKSAIIWVVVLLFALSVIISERDWIRDAAITLWVSVYSFLSGLWRF
jgi:hypothetical protein